MEFQERKIDDRQMMALMVYNLTRLSDDLMQVCNYVQTAVMNQEWYEEEVERNCSPPEKAHSVQAPKSDPIENIELVNAKEFVNLHPFWTAAQIAKLVSKSRKKFGRFCEKRKGKWYFHEEIMLELLKK